MDQYKKCRICGDNSASFNYNGQPSCSSCRLFFYRNADKHEKFKCRKNGNCDIDFVTRRCCAKCRMDKCFEIGMRVDLVKSLDRRKHKKKNQEDMFEEQIEECPKIFVQSTKSNSFELNNFELEQIQQIFNAISVFEEENSLAVVRQIHRDIDAYNQSQVYTRKIVKFCKQISSFQLLSPDDQIKYLRPFCFELMTIRYAFQYNLESNVITLIGNEDGNQAARINAQIFYQAKSKNLVEENLGILAVLNTEMENDKCIRNLLTTISLVKPQKSVLYPEFIRYQHHIFCHLLRRYLEHKYQCEVKALVKFNTLLSLLQNELIVIRDNVAKLLIEIGLNQVTEVIIESMNLNDYDNEYFNIKP